MMMVRVCMVCDMLVCVVMLLLVSSMVVYVVLVILVMGMLLLLAAVVLVLGGVALGGVGGVGGSECGTGVCWYWRCMLCWLLWCLC